jgi:hypothetical protein
MDLEYFFPEITSGAMYMTVPKKKIQKTFKNFTNKIQKLKTAKKNIKNH